MFFEFELELDKHKERKRTNEEVDRVFQFQLINISIFLVGKVLIFSQSWFLFYLSVEKTNLNLLLRLIQLNLNKLHLFC